MSLDPHETFREFELPEISEAPKRRFDLIRRVFRKFYRGLSLISPISGVLALIMVLISIFYGYPVYKNYGYTDPKNDGYVAPRSPGDIVDLADRSSVVVDCQIGENGGAYGSGWAINLKPSTPAYKSVIITNHHVIEDCLDGKGKIVVVYGENLDEYESVVDVIDEENDLARLSTKLKIPYLDLSKYEPFPGYWVMTYGTSDGYVGSVSFGAVMNATRKEILMTANISHGNSGGPLLDNEGNVVGTNTWSSTQEQYNAAKSLNAMCERILKCKYANGKRYWKI